jgi:hypothetical protein
MPAWIGRCGGVQFQEWEATMNKQTRKQINIFISHKVEDQQAAIGVRKVLESIRIEGEPPSLKFFLSEEIPGGYDWYRWIRERLVESNLLLLLFTDATRSWDWCLYEAGLFDRLDDDHHQRVICLHSKNTSPPDPLRNLRAFCAEVDHLRTFLRQLFLGTELTGLEAPLAPWLEAAPDRLERAAEDIARLVNRGTVETHYYSKYVFVHVQDPSKLAPDRLPEDAPVESNDESLRLFDKRPGNWTWKDLEAKARLNEDQRWLEELSQAVYGAARGDIPKSIQAVFRAVGGERIYRPTLYRVDRLADGSMTFKVLFEEDVSWKLDAIPLTRRDLLTALVMATRFRYELIERFRGTLLRLPGPPATCRTCEKIRDTIEDIEVEARSRGQLDQPGLLKAFSSEEDIQAVRRMYEAWYVLRSELFQALDEADCARIEKQLAALADINAEFLQRGSRRYHELMCELGET